MTRGGRYVFWPSSRSRHSSRDARDPAVILKNRQPRPRSGSWLIRTTSASATTLRPRPARDGEPSTAAGGREQLAAGAPLDLLGDPPEEPRIIDQENGRHGGIVD